MARTTRDGWCSAALALVRDEGPDALTLERVCAAMGRTRGSFYHHFADMDALYAALFESWRATHTEAPIAHALQHAEVGRRREQLEDDGRKLDHRLELALRSWALRDERARAALASVDGQRIDFLEKLHAAEGHRRPRLLAELEYLAFVGSQQLGMVDQRPHTRALDRALTRALALLSRDFAEKEAQTKNRRRKT